MELQRADQPFALRLARSNVYLTRIFARARVDPQLDFGLTTFALWC